MSEKRTKRHETHVCACCAMDLWRYRCGSVARSGYAQDACACVMQCSHMHSELRLLVRSLHACSGRQRARIAVHALMSVVLARRTGDASAAHEAAEAEAVP